MKLVEKDLGLSGAVIEESSAFLQEGYPCAVLTSCFRVPPEWPSVVSLHFLFIHSVHILVSTSFSSFLFYILSGKTYSYTSCRFSEFACEPFLPSEDFFGVVANPLEVGT